MAAVPLMTKQKFREETGLGRDKLDELIKLGVIPVLKLGSRTVLINLARLEYLILEVKVKLPE